MRKIALYSMFVLLAAAMALSGCASAATQSAPTQALASNPNATLVLNMVERLNAGDIDGSLAYFAEGAVSYFIGMPPTGMEFYRGREALRPMWKFCKEQNFKWEVEITRLEQDLVYAKTKTWLDMTREMGVAPNDFIDVFKIENGKITVYGSTMTEEALAEFKPALAVVMPPEPTPDLSLETPGTEMKFVFSDQVCTYEGPLVIQAGEIHVTWEIQDQDRKGYALTFFTLGEGKDIVDLMASTYQAGPPNWASLYFMKELGPGESQIYSATVQAEKGALYVVCWSKPPDIPIGNFGPLQVQP